MARFGWYELNTEDTESAKAFYGKVVGWTTQAWEHSPDYTMWVASDGPIGGLMKLPEEAKAMGAGPHWMGYVGVEDLSASVARAEELKGKVVVAPKDLPGGVRFALLADPTGAYFGMHQLREGAPSTTPQSGPGHFDWAELLTSDPSAAVKFYTELFGWVKTKAVNLGPAVGTYQMFADARGVDSQGGIMRRPSSLKHSAWIFYATVPDANAAVATVKAEGGKALNGPTQAPNGRRYAMYSDPQGVVAAVIT